MQIGGIIAIIIAAAVSGAAVVSLGLGLGLGLGMRKPCGTAKLEKIVSPSVDYICFDNAQSSTIDMQLSGSGLMRIGDTAPTVTVFVGNSLQSAATYYPKTSLPNPCAYEGSCTVSSTLSNSLFGTYNTIVNLTAYVDNPDPCNTATDSQLTTFTSKSMNSMSYTAVYLKVTNIAPQQPLPVSTIFTNGFGNTITVTGSGFIVKNIGGVWQYPTVSLLQMGNNVSTVVPVYTVDQCTKISSMEETYACNIFTLRVYGNEMASKNDKNSFSLGRDWYNKDLAVAVSNAVAGQATSCSTSSADYTHVDNSKRIFLFEAPEITAVTPNQMCVINSTAITITGNEFLLRRNADLSWSLPTLTIGGVSIPVDTMNNCVNMIASAADSGMYPADSTLQQCSEIKATIPANTFPTTQLGDLPLAINNPAPFPAPTTSTNLLTVSPLFCPLPPAPTPSPPPTECPIIDSYEVVPTEGHLTFCASPVEGATQGIVINGKNFHPTSKVSLIYSANNVTNESIVTTSGYIEYHSPRQIVAYFYRNLLNGTYVINVTNVDDARCNPTQSLFTVPIYPIRWMTYTNPSVVYNKINTDVDVFTIGFLQNEYLIAFLLPEYSKDVFGSPISVPFHGVSDSKVTITVPNTVPAGSYQVIIVGNDGCGTQPMGPNLIVTNSTKIDLSYASPSKVLRSVSTSISVFINTPVEDGEEAIAQFPQVYMSTSSGSSVALSGISVATDGTSLVATVPSNLTAGAYDVIVVNPSGAVGTGSNFVTVVDNEAAQPIVFAVSPTKGTATVTAVITGVNFESDTTVSISCKQPDGSTANFGVSVTSATSTELQVSVPFNAPAANSICTLQVTNPSSGLSFSFSQLVTGDFMAAFSSAPALTTATTKTSLVASRLTTSHTSSGDVYLYAFDGSEGSPNTVEIGQVNVPVTSASGISWSTQQIALSGVDSLANQQAVRVENMIYLIGGKATTTTNKRDTATNVVNTVYRAAILDSLVVPTITSISTDVVVNGTGLGEGNWYYTVSAVYGASDASNPNGESLPASYVSITTPPVHPGMLVSLQWEELPNAVAYNVYRTALPNTAASTMVLLDTVTTLSYNDKGEKTPAQGAKNPLKEGALGNFVLLSATMNKKREQFGATVVNVGEQYFIYAVGGYDETEGALSSYEYLPITVTPSTEGVAEVHTVGSWTNGAHDLPNSKAQASVTSSNNVIFIGPGVGENNIYYATVSATGDLEAIQTSQNSPSGENHDSCLIAASGRLYVIGQSTLMANATTTVGAWSAGNALSTPRTGAGCAIIDSMVFVAGGSSSKTVEYTLA
jgi:hypothetical protein